MSANDSAFAVKGRAAIPDHIALDVLIQNGRVVNGNGCATTPRGCPISGCGHRQCRPRPQPENPPNDRGEREIHRERTARGRGGTTNGELDATCATPFGQIAEVRHMSKGLMEESDECGA